MIYEINNLIDKIIQLKEMINREILDEVMPLIVETVRGELARSYDVENFYSENFRYNGLCNTAAFLVKAMFRSYMSFYNSISDKDEDYEVKIVHGEQRHTPNLESKYWACEHTWVAIRLLHQWYYIDPTSQQFQKLYDDIPEYYISTKPPKWYLPDKYNWRFSKFGKFLDKFKFKYKDEYGTHNISLTDYLVFIVWGKLSDKIGKINAGR